MNILLTGGAGYIGSHTAVELAQAGHQVVLFDNFCNSQRSVVDRLHQLLGFHILCVEGDVRNTQHVTKTLTSNEIDTVIHFAALKAVGESNEIPLAYYSNNIQGTLSLLEAMKLAGINRLVFSSSATVYGDPEYLPIDEEHPLKATSPYGRTKLFVEQILKDVTAAEPDWHIHSLRYFNPVGAHSSALIGENPSGPPNNLVPYISKVAAGVLETLEIFGNDYSTVDGTGVRDYIHIEDLAHAHFCSVQKLDKTVGFDSFNIGVGHGYSVLEMVRQFEAASHKSIPYAIGPRRLGDIATCFAASDKAAKHLGWYAKLGIADMCESQWRWQSSSIRASGEHFTMNEVDE
jgi:UDP-glucose 4-epimerase